MRNLILAILSRLFTTPLPAALALLAGIAVTTPAAAEDARFGPIGAYSFNSGSSTSTLAISLAEDRVAFVAIAGTSGSISALHFRLATVTVGEPVRVSLQDVDPTTGDPDGTSDQVAVVSVASTDDNVWKTAYFPTTRSVTAGETFAVVFEFDSSVGNLQLRINASTELRNVYCTKRTLGVWTKRSTYAPLMACEYDDGSYPYLPGVFPGMASLTSFSVNTNPNQRGNVFVPNMDLVASGATLSTTASGDAEVLLYDSDGTTVLATAFLNSKLRHSTSIGPYMALFPTPITLSAGQSYRLVLRPTTATSTALSQATLGDSAWLAAMPFGVDVYMTTRSTAGTWTDTPSARVHILPILSKLANDCE